jgi:hypothetical protein
MVAIDESIKTGKQVRIADILNRYQLGELLETSARA